MSRRRNIALPSIADLQAASAGSAPAVLTAGKVNREAWLENAVKALTPLFEEQGLTVPPVRVSCGFPKGNVRKVIGQCWPTGTTTDGMAQMFITPFLSDATAVMAVLIHEMVHAVDDCASGHKGAFARMAKSLGLEGKMTSTTASPALKARLEAIVEEGLGEYPHAGLSQGDGPDKKQGTRMLKVVCPEDGYTLRTTAKWLAVGLPSCPCGMEMEQQA